MWAALVLHIQFKWQKDRVSLSWCQCLCWEGLWHEVSLQELGVVATGHWLPVGTVGSGAAPARGLGFRADLVGVWTGVTQSGGAPRAGGGQIISPAFPGTVCHQNEDKTQQITKLSSVGTPMRGFILALGGPCRSELCRR